MGGGTSTPATTSSQASLIYGNANLTANTYVALVNASGSNVISFKVPRTYSGACMLISAPGMTKGSTYTLKSAVTVSGGTDFMGLNSDGTITNGSTVSSISLSSQVTTINYSGGGPGGGGGVPPGGGRP